MPQPLSSTLPRPHVTRLLDEAVAHPLTLVTGGLGTGKTTAVAAWTRDGSLPGPVAWVSLDRALSTPPRVWAAIVAALNSALGSDALGPLRPPSDLDEEFVETLAARLTGHPVVLVLDDVHELAPEVLPGLDQLLRMPPAGLHAVLISRHVPVVSLHRHRIAGRLGEVRSDDLAFTREEIGALAAETGVTADRDDLDHLHRVTDGWAAAVRLALLLLGNSSDPKHTLASFSGEQPLVAGYLAEELERSLSPELIDVLKQTSITDRICVPLARALVGDDGLLQALWATLGSAPLVAELAGTGWFRYHPLLLQLFRSRLRRDDPEQYAALHSRASAWYEGHGEWLTALDHAIESGDTTLAIRVALRSATVEFFAGGRDPLANAIAGIQSMGPADGAELFVLRAMGAKCRREHQLAADLLARAIPRVNELPEPRRTVAMLNVRLIEAALARVSGDGDRLIAAGLAAAALLGGLECGDAPGWSRCRGVPSTLVGIGHLWLGRPTAAVASLTEVGESNASVVFTDFAELTRASHTALALVIAGDNARGRDLADRVIATASARGNATDAETAQAWLALALILQQEDRRPELERALRSAGQAADRAADPFVDGCLHGIRARHLWLCGDVSGGARELGRARHQVAVHPGLRYVRRGCTSLAIWADLTIYRSVDAAVRVLDEDDRSEAVWSAQARDASALSALTPPDDNMEEDPLTIMRARLLLATGQPERVRDALGGAPARPGAVGAHAWVAIAMAEDQMRHDARATEAIGRALDAAAHEHLLVPFRIANSPRLVEILRRHREVTGTHREFVDVILRVLAGEAVARAVARPLTEPLTEREEAVLAYLPTMRSNAEIAEALGISVNTIKQHLKSVHRKLGVSTRREAVRVARDLNLLPEGSTAP